MVTAMNAKILTWSDIAKCDGKRVAIDVETTGLEWYKHKLIGVGLWCPDADIYGYIPTLDDASRKIVKQAISALSAGTTIIAHNAKFDLHFLDADPQPWIIVDPMVAGHLLNSKQKKSLVDMEMAYLGTSTKRDIIQSQPTRLRNKIWDWSTEQVAEYCINDVRIEYALAELLIPMLRAEGLLDLFIKDMQYLKLIWRIERKGVYVDVSFVISAKNALLSQAKELEGQLYDAVGYEFNWHSSQQLSKALYEDLSIPRPVNPFKISRFNRDGGKYNSTLTSRFILMEKAHHPLGELVTALRETTKLANYLDDWLERLDESDNIHTNYNLTGTRTGRLSSGQPNLQNVPAQTRNYVTQAVFSGDGTRTDEYNLRNAIISRPGYTFVSVDYKQMEMRMFGKLSGDPFMLESLNAGRDIHADIAEQVWGVRDTLHREWAKTISFGLIYGMSTGSLQFKLDLTPEKARQITDDYWNTFPRIKPWLYGMTDECRKNGYVTYWSGRRWHEDKDEEYFKAANALIQGGCADLLSIAALRVDDWLRQTGYGHIVMLVHDEIIAEVLDEHVDEVVRNMRKIMEVPDLLGITWLTDAKTGKSYGALQQWQET